MELDGKTERMTGTAHDKPSGGIPWSRLCAYFFTFLITFLFVDFFQVKESARHGSFDQFNRYFATTYPECIPKRFGEIFRCMFAWESTAESGRNASPMVSVVLWTDKMLRASGKAWPIRMEDHARVLETILPMQPRGVLVDLFFLDDPEIRGDTTLQDLIDVICDYHEASETESGTRLYLIKPGASPDTKDSGTESGSDPLIAGTLTSGVEQECGLDLTTPGESGAVRLVSAELSHSPSRIYPKHGAAVEMFSSDSGLEDFHIFWANSANQMFLDRERCMTGASGFPGNVMEVFSAVTRQTADSLMDRAPATPPCPYAPVISAHVVHCLRTAPAGEPLAPDRQACGLNREQHAAVAGALRDKYVIYGAELHGLGDIYDVPIHDGYRLSGVFVHAMALDNLLETGGKVHLAGAEHRPRVTKAVYYTASALLATVLFFVAKHVFFDLWHRLVHDGIKARSLLLRSMLLVGEVFLWMAFVIACAGALIWLTWMAYRLSFLYEPFRFGIMNWVAILVVSGLLAIWVKQPFADELGSLLHEGWEEVKPRLRTAKSRWRTILLRMPWRRRNEEDESR